LRKLALILLLFVAWPHTLAQTEELPPGVTIHVAQRGESLWRIARDSGVSVEAIAALNGIPPTSGLQVGQRLLIPVPGAGVSLPASTALALPPVDVLHVVVSGETLFRIAQQYNVAMQAIIQANNLANPSVIYAGQRLIVPGVQQESQVTNLPSPFDAFRLRPFVLVEGQAAGFVVTTTTRTAVTGTFLGASLNIIADTAGTTHYSVFGVPVFTAAGTYPLVLSAGGTTQEIQVTVAEGGYPTTDITLSPEQETLLAPAVEEFEISALRNLASAFNPVRSYEGAFGLPAAAPMNAPYGTRRSYNGGTVSRYHNGADFAAPPGTPVLAVAPGRIVLADLLNIRGNTVLIDHGWGVYSLYAHLTAINVGLGQTVTSGQVIGTSGSTGRVTGPHLHWELWVSGVPVDPMLWTQYSLP